MMRRNGQIRIIAGRWRGRRIPVPNEPGLRPTTDRVRETVFNWLSPYLPESACLDLFAGSGALGFEAASRGASHVVMVERARRVVLHLQKWQEVLQADNIDIYQADARQWLRHHSRMQFDLIFVDPPFQANLHSEIIHTLADTNLIKDDGLVYVETDQRTKSPFWDHRFVVLKSKDMGGISARVLRFKGNARI